VTRRALLLDIVVRVLYPAMLVFSLWILVRGHNDPGGGFIAGMIAVAATAIRAIASGTDAARRALPLEALRLSALGVAMALASGLAALASGQPFLTHLWATLPIGGVKVSTVLAFDLGVYLSVWGALGGIAIGLIALDEEEPS